MNGLYNTVKMFSSHLQLDNIGFKDFPVDVSLFFPTKLEHNFEVIDYKVFVSQVVFYFLFSYLNGSYF